MMPPWELRMRSRITVTGSVATPYEELLRRLVSQKRKGQKKRLNEPERGVIYPRIEGIVFQTMRILI